MKLGLLGDTMLGRGVATKLHEEGPSGLFDDGVVGVLAEADLVVANLECCISLRGEPADKRFVFRAPPVATEALAQLGVDVVTLANNHSLDFGVDALTDTMRPSTTQGSPRLAPASTRAKPDAPMWQRWAS